MSKNWEILPLHQGDESIAREIHDVFQSAYKVEAELLQAEFFPPLERGFEEINYSKSEFFGIRIKDRLAAVIEIAREEDSLFISNLAVHPDFFRRGLATGLLSHVLDFDQIHIFYVSTAEANVPALNLYRKYGFEKKDSFMSPEDIELLTLRLTKD